MSEFSGKTLLITGGTGSFGNAVLKRFINEDFKEIRIFSRDEKKQDDMRHKLNNPKVNFIIGSDIVDTLEKWHDWEYLKTHVRFYCFTRGEGATRVPEGVEIIFIPSPLTEASSTEVRKGEFSVLSPSVLEYIEDAGLYRN